MTMKEALARAARLEDEGILTHLIRIHPPHRDRIKPFDNGWNLETIDPPTEVK